MRAPDARVMSTLTWMSRTVVHATWITALGIVALVMADTSAGGEQQANVPEALPSDPMGDALAEARMLQRAVATEIRQQERAGLSCRFEAIDGVIPTVIIQHRAVDLGNSSKGWRSVASFSADEGFVQAGLGETTARATHWSDAFCYA